MIAGRFARFALALSLLLSLMTGAAAAQVTVFAAASLKTALDAVARAYQAETGTAVAVSYAGTSALARQIRFGAPADVFLSASTDWMDALAADGRIVDGSRVDLVTNRLVLIGPPGAAPVALEAEAIAGALGQGRLAMALVDAVPAGIYGQAALRHLGLWASLGPFVAQTDNVRAALALVATGAAPLGIVYATDARAEPRVAVLATFPADTHAPIVYPAAVVARGKETQAQRFLTFLRGPTARKAFHQQGFGDPPPAGS